MRFGKQFIGVSATLISLWIGAPLAMGQSPLDCPTISVTVPGGITNPGDWMDFTGKISGVAPPNLKFHWTVSYEGKTFSEEGDVFRGQGTRRLWVLAPQRVGAIAMNIGATLKVEGLPVGCPNSVSESAPYVVDRWPELVDEYQRLKPVKESVRLDNLVFVLRDHPEDKLYFIEYFPAGTSRTTIARRIAWISAQLKRRGIQPWNFEIVTSDSPTALTKIYRRSPWVGNPEP